MSWLDDLQRRINEIALEKAESSLREQLHNEKQVRLRCEAMQHAIRQQKADADRAELQTEACREQLRAYLPSSSGKGQAS